MTGLHSPFLNARFNHEVRGEHAKDRAMWRVTLPKRAVSSEEKMKTKAEVRRAQASGKRNFQERYCFLLRVSGYTEPTFVKSAMRGTAQQGDVLTESTETEICLLQNGLFGRRVSITSTL